MSLSAEVGVVHLLYPLMGADASFWFETGLNYVLLQSGSSLLAWVASSFLTQMVVPIGARPLLEY